MRRGWSIALLLVAGCAAAKPRVAPAPPLVIGSGRAAPEPGPALPSDARPAGVAAWLRAERADTLVGLAGLGSPAFAAEIAPVLASIDTGQAVDVVLTAGAETRKLYDLVPVLRFHVRDAKALVAIAEKELDVREEGDRVYARPRGAAEDDHFACVLSHTDTAVCSTVDGVNRYGAWLADVQPPPGPPARLTIYGSPTARLLSDDGDLGALERELETLTIDLDDAQTGEGLRATLRLATRTSRLAIDLARATGPATEAFTFRDASGSMSFPGGGALPAWAKNGFREPAVVREVVAAAFAKPVAMAAYVPADRARAALAAARRAPSRRAWSALDEALEPRYVLAGDVPLADVARAVRAMAGPGTSATVRPARGGLATGSFVYERSEPADENGAPPRRTAVLGTRFAARTWLVVGPNEADATELLKKVVVERGPDVPHLLLRGELPASLGIDPALRRELRSGPTADTLRRIEAELAAPSRSAPLVVTTATEGSGLVVTATMSGSHETLHRLLEGDAASTWLKTMVYAIVLH